MVNKSSFRVFKFSYFVVLNCHYPLTLIWPHVFSQLNVSCGHFHLTRWFPKTEDPKNDSGFKALPDDYSFPVEDILKSRRLYFQEAEIVPQLVMQSFLGATRMKYEEIKENRSLVRYGAAFIMGTILLDWLVCSI